MSLIVSTHKHILCIPEIEETHYVIHSTEKEIGMSTGCYGITWNKKTLFAKSNPKNKGSFVIGDEKILGLKKGSHQWYYCPRKDSVLITDTEGGG